MIKIELHYFSGCPNATAMRENVRTAIQELDFDIDIDYKEKLIDTPEKAAIVKFRGSPTLLVNNFDFEDLEEPAEPSLRCRLYRDGIPHSGQILNFIKKIAK